MSTVTKGLHHRLSVIDTLFKTADCSMCGVVDIYWNNNRWICSVAKMRISRNHRLRTYGISDLEQEIIEKTTVCDLCRVPFKNNKDKYTDHSHTENKFRGVLCMRCNTTLGQVEDSIELLAQAIQYLEKFK